MPNKRSNTWQFYVRFASRRKVRCKVCFHELALTPNCVGNLKRHLYLKHPKIMESETSRNKFISSLSSNYNELHRSQTSQSSLSIWGIDSEHSLSMPAFRIGDQQTFGAKPFDDFHDEVESVDSRTEYSNYTHQSESAPLKESDIKIEETQNEAQYTSFHVSELSPSSAEASKNDTVQTTSNGTNSVPPLTIKKIVAQDGGVTLRPQANNSTVISSFDEPQLRQPFNADRLKQRQMARSKLLGLNQASNLTTLQKSIRELQKTISDNLERNDEDEFDLFGKSIALQLKRMPLERAFICQESLQRVMIQERLQQNRS